MERPAPPEHDGARLGPLSPAAVRSDANTWVIEVQVPGRVHRSRVWIGIDFTLKGVEVSVIFFETHLNFSARETGMNLVGVTEAIAVGELSRAFVAGHVEPFFSVGLKEPNRWAGLDYFESCER